ncbi:basic amino acid ABC transporter substrate-binding protein [Megasphaera cerevisiae]|uniref:basic amino acid ABC transporter substrate-binding protein n=1 Tax=Megasphaera cerevisiae TaxID=39029 RepID=UPI000942F3FA|nr:basic amino acid ABC transporter substrate-binding protein [Megasphaera cerevisiae]OKY52853.1 basic amino acid ABC transporter substrate-binding protein [Megasphaera cerevisiae]
MNKKSLAIAVAAMATVAFTAGCGSSAEKAAANADKTLIVGMEPTFPPFEFTEDDKYVGFDIDYAQAICDKMGVKMEIKSMGFDALIPALKSGQIDMIASGMDATPERAKQVAFTNTYFHDGYSVVVRKDNNTIHGFDDLSGHIAGSQVGTKGVDLAQSHGAEVKQYDANSQGWMELNSGTCDAVVINTSVALYYLKQGGDKDLKIAGEPQLAPDGIAMAVSKDKPEQLEKVNSAIQELKSDGTYAALYKKWFGVEPRDN